jgi:hypothetical protein
LRGICKKHFEANPIRLGGNGVVCQVDESLFSKHHRGRTPGERVWGCRHELYSCSWIHCVERRNSETLLIERMCLKGSVIVADGWAAYPEIETRGYGFSFVNHSENFVDPVTGVHTQLE